MDKKYLEQLSQCIDNEMPQEELPEFMNRLINDPDLLHLWGLKFTLSTSLQAAASRAHHKLIALPKKID